MPHRYIIGFKITKNIGQKHRIVSFLLLEPWQIAASKNITAKWPPMLPSKAFRYVKIFGFKKMRLDMLFMVELTMSAFVK